MVSAGVCFGGKSRLHFVEEKAKVNAGYYVGSLLPVLVDDCRRLLPSGFLFQQDGAPAHTARQTQEWLKVNCTDFIAKDQWPPNSPDLNPLDYHVWGAMLQAFHKLQSKPQTIPELTRSRAVARIADHTASQQTLVPNLRCTAHETPCSQLDKFPVTLSQHYSH